MATAAALVRFALLPWWLAALAAAGSRSSREQPGKVKLAGEYKNMKAMMRDFLDTSEDEGSSEGFGLHMQKKGQMSALVLMTTDSDPLDVVIPAYMLRRANLFVRVSSLNQYLENVEALRDTVFIPDTGILKALEYAPYDVLIVTGGGPGIKNFTQTNILRKLLQAQDREHNLIVSIGLAIKVLCHFEYGLGRLIASPPELQYFLRKAYVIDPAKEFVQDGNVITCRQSGSLAETMFKILEALFVSEKHIKRLRKEMNYYF